MGNAGLDNERWAHGPDQFLHGNHVFRVLDDGATQPVEVVEVLLLHRVENPVVSERIQRRIGGKQAKPLFALAGELLLGIHGRTWLRITRRA